MYQDRDRYSCIRIQSTRTVNYPLTHRRTPPKLIIALTPRGVMNLASRLLFASVLLAPPLHTEALSIPKERVETDEPVPSSPQTFAKNGTHVHHGLRWLVATAVSCACSALAHRHAGNLAALLHKSDSLWINSFACGCQTINLQLQASLRLFHIAGMKHAFWKQELTPSAIAAWDVLWLIDSDVVPYTRVFSLQSIEHWFRKTGALVMQPAVVRPANDVNDFPEIAQGAYHIDCVVKEVLHVEQMTPMLLRRGWELFYNGLLSRESANGSLWGYGHVWCHFARTSGSGCAVMQDVHVVHLDTHDIEKFNKTQEYRNHRYKEMIFKRYLGADPSVWVNARRREIRSRKCCWGAELDGSDVLSKVENNSCRRKWSPIPRLGQGQRHAAQVALAAPPPPPAHSPPTGGLDGSDVRPAAATVTTVSVGEANAADSSQKIR